MSGLEPVLVSLALGAPVLLVVLVATSLARGARAELRFRLLLVGLLAATSLPWLRPLAPTVEVPVLAAPAPAAAAPRTASWDLTWVLPTVWALGAALLLARLVRDRRSLARLEREARPLTDAVWRALVASIAGELGITRQLRVLVHPNVGSPATWGLRRPLVLLPKEALTWSVDRRRAMLLHELEHVRRLDAPIQTLVEVCCALRWFDPITWIARRCLRRERELACDQRVVASGARPSRYARMLLDLYRRLAERPAPPRLAAVPFGLPRTRRRSEIELRLGGLLDGGAGGERRAVGVTALGLGLLLPLATLTPIQRAAAEWNASPPPVSTAAVVDPLPHEPRFRPTTVLGPQEELRAPAPPGAPRAPTPRAAPDLSSLELFELIDDAEPQFALNSPLGSFRVYDVYVTR